MARPKAQIDKDQFEKLCSMFCSQIEIADFFNVTDDTIQNWCKRTYKLGFSEVYKRKSSRGKMSIRRKQFEVAMDGNTTMLIWLGKQYLGQADKMDFVEEQGFEFIADKV